MLVWEKMHQDKYYNQVINKYLVGLFQKLLNSNFGFFWNPMTPLECLNNIKKYYSDHDINLNDFQSTKKFVKHLPEFLVTDNEEYNKLEEQNVIFTVEDLEIHDKHPCRKCGILIGGGISFSGRAFNTMINGENPIKYCGGTKTYYFNVCKCDNIPDQIIVNNPEDLCMIPEIEIWCTPIDHSLNISLLRRMILFDLFFVEMSSIQYTTEKIEQNN
jgi:hypothetical protein